MDLSILLSIQNRVVINAIAFFKDELKNHTFDTEWSKMIKRKK
jgi:hypothetical protein